MFNDNSDFDLMALLNTKYFTVEVKYDMREARSRNVAIEFFNPKSGKPTGIDVTKADLWVHVLTNPLSAWVTNVGLLRRYIRDNDPLRIVECGGDENASFFLYKREKIFSDIFQQLDGLSPVSLWKLIKRMLNGSRNRTARRRPQSTRQG